MNYRSEIDGLRAFAVTAVVLFHAGFDEIKGGFLGVDVFFVISGFLITTIIFDSLDSGSFRFGTFYAKRARRILPVLLAVLILCIPLAWEYFFPDQLKHFATSLGCASFFASNIFYLSQSGYFSPDTLEDPIVHLWTLSIEEQFYLLAPAILVVVCKYARSVVTLVLLGMLGLSVIYGNQQIQEIQDAAFFNTGARVWEILSGSVIASIKSNEKWGETIGIRSREIISFLSVATMLFCILVSGENTIFPSFTYYLVVISAAMFLFFSTAETWVGKILSLKVVTYFGLISYSAYLWHQPILAFSRVIWNADGNPLFKYFLLIPILFVSHCSWKLIEKPFRRANWGKGQIAGSCVLIFLLFAFGLAGNLTAGFEKWRTHPTKEGSESAFEQPEIGIACSTNFSGVAESEFCTFGKEDAIPTVAVYGDSHSFPLRAMFHLIGKEQNIGMIGSGLGGCPPLANVYVLNGHYSPSICHELISRQIAFVREHAIKDVFLVARWSLYTDGSYRRGSKIDFLIEDLHLKGSQEHSRKMFVKALRETVQIYNSLGARVHVVTQAPMQLYNPRQIYNRWYASDEKVFEKSLRKYSVPYLVHLNHQKFVRSTLLEYSARPSVDVIDLDEFFCDKEYCLVGDAGSSYYEDFNHLSASGALKIHDLFKNFFATNSSS